mgnify:FL=1
MNTTKVFQIALRLAPLLMGQSAAPTQIAKPILDYTQKDLALLNIRQKKGSVTVILGSRDTGKTELCYRFAEFLGRPTFGIFPQQMPPSWITKLTLDDIFTKVPRMSTLICDDLPSYASNRDYNDLLIRALEKAIPMVRHEPHPPEYPLGEIHLIFSSQSSAQADKYILDADMALFKPLGLLMGAVERPAVDRIYRTYVNPEFEGKDDSWIHNHAYLMTRTWRGIISITKVE